MTSTVARQYVPVRLGAAALAEVQRIADAQHQGNRSAALRQLLRLGLLAYREGRR